MDRPWVIATLATLVYLGLVYGVTWGVSRVLGPAAGAVAGDVAAFVLLVPWLAAMSLPWPPR